MILTAVVYEDAKPVRLFKDNKCIYSAYCWAHRHYCLEDLGLPVSKLPEWLEIKIYMLTDEQIKELLA